MCVCGGGGVCVCASLFKIEIFTISVIMFKGFCFPFPVVIGGSKQII